LNVLPDSSLIFYEVRSSAGISNLVWFNHSSL